MASADVSALSGKRVLITGAARGIGAALAGQLASHGARLALVGLEPEMMEAVARRCGEGTFMAECDVSRERERDADLWQVAEHVHASSPDGTEHGAGGVPGDSEHGSSDAERAVAAAGGDVP